jgi:predicted Zn-dependent protease
VRQEMGLYEDDDLQRYVQELGMRLARASERPNLPWSFAVVDSPAVNAFALPGGYIYITRGILPYLENEAQLVGVLGHEIGHVTARHSAQQYTRGMGASLGVLVGSIFVPEIRPFTDLAEGGLGVLFLKFGRDDEIQADALGAAYTAGGGWDPAEVPAFLTTLARIAETTDRNGVPNWLATHPQPENRAEVVGEAVKKVRTAGAADNQWAIDREEYLSRIDGLVFGDNPEEGVVRGSLFLHAPLRFALEFPQGWDITNSEEQVVAQEPGNKVFMVLRTIEPRMGRSLDQVAQEHMRESGYKATNLTSTTIGGLQAVVGTYEGSASGIGKVMARGAHVVHTRNTYFIGGIAPPDLYPRVAPDFDRAIQSFRQLSESEADAIRPNILDFYTARAGDSWQSIAQGPGRGLVTASTLAIMNGHAIGEQPAPGARLKIVVAGS